MTAHNQELIRRLKGVASQIEMAIEDAGEDFRQGLAHAEIALAQLREVVDAGKSHAATPAAEVA